MRYIWFRCCLPLHLKTVGESVNSTFFNFKVMVGLTGYFCCFSVVSPKRLKRFSSSKKFSLGPIYDYRNNGSFQLLARIKKKGYVLRTCTFSTVKPNGLNGMRKVLS